MKACFVLVLIALFSCSSPQRKSEAVARVGESYLYADELKGLIPAGTTKADSAVIVRSFIDRWASQKLLTEAAEVNLDAETQSEFDGLIRQYKNDLYTKAYIEQIVKRSVDTVIGEKEIEEYYRQNKENFKTNGTLVRLRYICLPKENPKYELIKRKFFDFRKSDRKFWDTYAMQLKSFAFNDTVWTDMEQVYAKLPFINPENRDAFIQNGKSIQHADSLDMYLVKITGITGRNQVSPYEYIKPMLREVLLNRRKLELIKKFEKEITDDAIKDKKYEVYN